MEGFTKVEKFKRAERITLLIVFLLTIPILVSAFINNNGPNGGGYGSNWIKDNVIGKVVPTGFQAGSYYGPYTSFQPGVPFWLTLGVTLLIFLPMSLKSKTRYAGAVGMMVASLLFAALLWVYSLGIVWGSGKGMGITIFGLLFGYVGIIPIAFFLAIIPVFQGLFEPLIIMLVLTACFVASRKIKNHALSEHVETNESITEKFKRAERVALSIVLVIAVIILIFTFIYNDSHEYFTNNIHGNAYNTPHEYWIWNAVIENIMPTGFFGGTGLSPYPDYPQPGIPVIFWLTPAAALLIFLPMSLSKKKRHAGALGMMICSYIFAGFLWIYSLGVVWYAWEAAGTIAGVALGFVGIIPEALVITLGSVFAAGRWAFIIPLLFLAACFIFTRIMANYARKKYIETEESLVQEENKAAVQ